MKYLEIYFEQRQKEINEKRQKIIKDIKRDIEHLTDEEISEHICTDYAIFLTQIEDWQEELNKLKQDLLGVDKE